MIGLDPLAWLSPDSDSPNKSKKKSKKKAKKKAKKKNVAKKKSTPKNKAVASKKKVSKSATKKEAVKNQVSEQKSKTEVSKYVSPLGLDVELLEESFSLLSGEIDELVASFYKELFEQYPSVQPMFENTSIDDQQKKLSSSITLVINNIRKPEVLAEALKDLGLKHQGYGAVPEHFQAVATTLISVMRDMAGSAWTNDFQLAWEVALQKIAEVMLSGYGEVAEKLVDGESNEEGLNQQESEQALSTGTTETESTPLASEETTVSDTTIRLSEVQDISQVAELHRQVSNFINSDDFTLDGSAVERIDASTLQLITCAFIQADKYGNKVSWSSSSDALKKSAKLLGLEKVLAL